MTDPPAPPLASLRPGGTATAEQVMALVLDIFAAIQAETMPERGAWSGGFNAGIGCALLAAGEAVRRHGLTAERGKL